MKKAFVYCLGILKMNKNTLYAWVWESEELKQMGKAWKKILPVGQRPSMRFEWIAVTPLYTESLDFAQDAREWGNALNDASWKFTETYRSVMGYPESGRLFNSVKTILREAILEYAQKLK